MRIQDALQNHAKGKLRYNANAAECYTAFARQHGDLTINSCSLNGDVASNEKRILRTKKKWKAFLAYMQRQGLSTSTQAQRLGILKRCLTELEDTKGIRIYRKMPKVSVAKKDMHIPLHIIQSILNFEPDLEGSREQDFLFLSKLQIVTVLRISDAWALKLSNLKGNMLKVRNKKTQTATIHPLPESYRSALEQRLSLGGVLTNPRLKRMSLPVFTGAYNEGLKRIYSNLDAVHETCEIIEQDSCGKRTVIETTYLKELTSHSMRHFAATYYAWKGLDKQVVSAMGGWSESSDVLNNIYKHTAPDAVMDAVLNVHS